MTAMVKANGHGLTVSGSVSINGIGEVFQLADALAKARGFVPKAYVGQPEAIAAAMLTGIELGIGPMEALRSLHVVDGKPTMAADFMLARAIRAGVRPQWLRCDAKEARVRLEREGFKPHEHSFTMEEAKAAGLAGKDNWRKYPAAMLRARCIAAALRAAHPDVLGAGVYTPEEVGAAVDESGDPIVVETAPREAIDAAPRGEPSAESGEAGYGGSCGEASEPVQAPRQLSDCADAAAIAAWVAANAAKLREASESTRAKTRDRVAVRAAELAAGLGLAGDEALEYVGGALATLEAALA